MNLTSPDCKMYLCTCVFGFVQLCLLSWLSSNKQGGLKGRNCVGGVVEKRNKKSDFSPSIPRGVCSGAFHSSCHISFPAVHICVCECVSVRCVHVWTMWGSCSTVVIYSDGLWPYLFSISLMLSSGFPPALPYPTGRGVWVGPLQICLESAPHAHARPHTHTHKPLSFSLLSSAAFSL